MIRRILTGAFASLLALSAVGPAAASEPGRGAPMDADPLPAVTGVDVFQTLPFALGEVDLASLGVSDAELASVGLAGAGIYEAGDGPNMRIVDDDQAECPNAAYTSIQAAVTASDAGDRIKVCPGLYQEQITISADKDDLVLFSRNPLQAVIKAPPTMAEPGDIVLVDGAQDVEIRQFTITGPLPDGLFCSTKLRTGVRVSDGGSALVRGNHITQIWATNPALRGCQNGFGIAAGRKFENMVLVDDTGTVWATQNLIDDYQKGGVYVDNEDSYGQIDHNEIVGPGPQPTIAPNGIQMSRGATGRVDHNKVSRNQYSLPSFAGTGIILLQQDGGLRVDHNEVFVNDDGISLYESTDLQIDHNKSHDQTRYDGLYAASDATGNTFQGNMAYRNFEHDCHDDTVVPLNTWLHNLGNTAFPAGICKARPAGS